MGDLHGVVGILILIAAIVGALIAIGGGGALVYGSFDKQAREALRQDNQDFKNRQDSLEHKVSELELKLEASEKENLRLQEQVTQRAKVDEAIAEIKRHSAAAEDWWHRLDTRGRVMEELTTAMVGSVTRLAQHLEADHKDRPES